jgi:hypothetical protein
MRQHSRLFWFLSILLIGVTLAWANWPAVNSTVPGTNGQCLINSSGNVGATDCIAGSTSITLTGDASGSGTGSITVTNGKVNGVSYPASPSTNTVPVVTSANTITYEALPNAALANSSVTIAGHSVSLGGTQALACGDLSNGASGCSMSTTAGGDLSGTLPSPTVAKVNGVSYPASPSTNTVPVVTSTNTITYEAVPNAALANSSMTLAGHSVSLGGTQTFACGDLSNGAGGCSMSTTAGGDLSGTLPSPTVAKVNGVAYSASPSNDTAPVITAANTATYKAIPACTDSGGNHLNYDTSTHAFSCGTSSSVAGGSGTVNSGTSGQLTYYASTGTAVSGLPAATTDGNALTWTLNAVAATPADGLLLTNTTAAANNAQQMSPRLRLHGSGWKTNATAATRVVDWTIENLPVQGAANPDTWLRFGYSINNAAYSYPITLQRGANQTALVIRYNSDAATLVDTHGTAGIELQSSSTLHFATTNPSPQVFFNNDTTLGIGSTASTVLDLHAGSTLSLVKIAGAQYTIQLDGQGARSLGMARQTTSNSAGNTLTIAASAATTSATDKNGGNLILQPGTSTGTGRTQVQIQGYTTATSTGTSNNTAVDREIVGGFKALTNNSATSIMNVTIANNTVAAGTLRYAVEVTDGTDFQVEEGFIACHATNKAGTVANNTCLKSGNQQATTSGTLTVTFTITAANPAVIQVNANSSLTVSTGYPRLTYNYDQLTQQAVAMQ